MEAAKFPCCIVRDDSVVVVSTHQYFSKTRSVRSNGIFIKVFKVLCPAPSINAFCPQPGLASFGIADCVDEHMKPIVVGNLFVGWICVLNFRNKLVPFSDKVFSLHTTLLFPVFRIHTGCGNGLVGFKNIAEGGVNLSGSLRHGDVCPQAGINGKIDVCQHHKIPSVRFSLQSLPSFGGLAGWSKRGCTGGSGCRIKDLFSGVGKVGCTGFDARHDIPERGVLDT